MAEKRMISKVISISKKVNLKLNSHFARLLYTWMIPHTDDFGRMAGCPHKVKALVIPMLDETWQEVESTLSELKQSKLIEWYEVNGEMYIEVVNFEEHQSGLHKRTKSKFPDIPKDSRKFPEIPLEENRTELNRTELNGREEKEEQKTALLKTINSLGIQTKGAYELDQVYGFLGIIEFDAITEAIKRSEKAGKLSYTLGILADRSKKKLYTIQDLIKAGEIPNGRSPTGDTGNIVNFGAKSLTAQFAQGG